MSNVYPAVGVLLLIVLYWDVFCTVFIPRGLSGPITQRFHHGCWLLWRALNPGSAPHTRKRLSRLGPFLVVFTVLLWAVTLWLAFALLFLPYTDQFFSATEKITDWSAALYISGYSVTTLGIGDITPRGPVLKLLMTGAAASGFVMISIAVTYFLSFYAALSQLTALSYEIDHFLGISEGCTPVDTVVEVIQSKSTEEYASWLASTSMTLAQISQAQQQYTLINYFHEPNDLALPVTLAHLLEITTIQHSLLSPDDFPTLSKGVVGCGVDRLVRKYFTGLMETYRPQDHPSPDLPLRREQNFEHAWKVLQMAGIPLRPREEAQHLYLKLRESWDVPCCKVRKQFGYPEVF